MSTWLEATVSEASFDRREVWPSPATKAAFNKRVTVEAGKDQNSEVVAR